MKLLPKLKEQASRLKRELHALWLAYSDPRTPWSARLLIVCVVAYALSPIDLIPDPIPIIGHLDDLILLPLDKPSQWQWIGTAFVVIVWLLIAMWMWRLIHRKS